MLAIILATILGQVNLTPEQVDAIKKAPPGSSFVIESVKTKDGGSITIEEEATGEGARLKASGEKIVTDFNASAPSAGLGNGRQATGSTTKSIETISGSVTNPLMWVGILCIVLSGASLIVRPPAFPVAIPLRATMIVGLVGVGLVAAAMFPMLTLFIVGGAVLCVVGPYVYREFAAQKLHIKAAEGDLAKETLRSVAAGIADFKTAAKDPDVPAVPPTSWEKLKIALDAHMLPDEKKVIDDVRAKDNLA